MKAESSMKDLDPVDMSPFGVVRSKPCRHSLPGVRCSDHGQAGRAFTQLRAFEASTISPSTLSLLVKRRRLDRTPLAIESVSSSGGGGGGGGGGVL